MRYSSSEKADMTSSSWSSNRLPAKRTLDKLGIPRATFYRWYDRYRTGGPEALGDHRSRPDRVWNRIPEHVRSQSAMAQAPPPKVGNKPLVQVKPKPPMGCKLVGAVKGTKLSAGDCIPSVSNSATIDPPAPAPLPARASSATTSDPK